MSEDEGFPWGFEYTEEEWRLICAEVGTLDAEARAFLLSEVNAYLRAVPLSGEQRRRLKQISKLATDLVSALQADKRLSHGLKNVDDWSINTDPVHGAYVFDDVLLRPQGSIIQQLWINSEILLDQYPSGRGSPGKPARSRLWTAAAITYEHAGHTVRTSKDTAQQPTGPFIRYITAISAPLMPNAPPTPGAIERFADDYRYQRTRGR
jgi:hypothetical protein